MIVLLCFVLGILASPFKSKIRLAAENAALRHQLIVLRRKLRGRVQLANSDRWFLVQLYRWFPSILKSGRSAASAWIISSFLVRRICAGPCDPMLVTTTTSEHIGHWIKMRRSLARFSALESSVRTRYSADFIITTPGSRFSAHTS